MPPRRKWCTHLMVSAVLLAFLRQIQAKYIYIYISVFRFPKDLQGQERWLKSLPSKVKVTPQLTASKVLHQCNGTKVSQSQLL